jgi:tetratricopeptide (TPR) repeat protein
MTTSLQAARTARGWSQTRAVWELMRLADSKGITVATAASLKTQLSRWENGHIAPDYYKPLLCELYGLTTGEIGFNASYSNRRGTGKALASVAVTPGNMPEVGDSPEPGPDTIVLNLRLEGKKVAVPISRRLLLRTGVSSFVETFALDQQLDMVHDILQRSSQAERLTIASPAHLQEILIHLHEQWHALVKTDNLLGPRFALSGVLNQISVVEALRSILRDEQRIEVARLGAKYAESAAWLYEDVDNMMQARFWTSQAMEWAYEGNDERMLAWTIFRRAQQAAAIPDAAQSIGLAQAARRDEEKLATPTRAAIRVQEAYGYALDGNDKAAQQLLDEAHTWAAGDTAGDAREGHGSYCTPDHIEIQRATCWLAVGQPKKAIPLYEDSLRTLPAVYQRNRAASLTWLAAAYAADSQPEQAANTAHAALPVARSAGSRRIIGEIRNVGTELIPYRALPAVAILLDELEAEDH